MPDLFHSLRDLGGIRRAWGVSCRIGAADFSGQLAHTAAIGKPTQLQEQNWNKLQAQYSSTQATQTADHAALRQLSLCVRHDDLRQ